MLHVDNFAYGVVTPLLAYLMSWLGAFTGLRCATRARAYEGPGRAFWLLLAAASIGIMGIWVMHFIAMLGFSIQGTPIRYDVSVTVISMLIAFAFVAAGLFIAGYRRPTLPNLLMAGAVTGAGVAAMHYTGMAAMRMHATMSYDALVLGLSVIIAMTAATVAFWFALRLRGVAASAGAALIMAAAVSGMHYTGMAALRVWPASGTGTGMDTGGATGASFLVPLIVGITVTSFVLIGHVALAPTEDEIHAEAALMARLRAHGMDV
jgi:NO-binding membrane sensor protein with MHYT domain